MTEECDIHFLAPNLAARVTCSVQYKQLHSFPVALSGGVGLALERVKRCVPGLAFDRDTKRKKLPCALKPQ